MDNAPYHIIHYPLVHLQHQAVQKRKYGIGFYQIKFRLKKIA